ncbi:MAG: GntR family transcriptional regulator [Clostridiales bacterium]|nr:GntR family transcriptional regulator [Clostridiales bacterium]
MAVKSIRQRGGLRLRVYHQLRDWILQGHYQNGMALTEARVSQELGVSRTPVREAFSQLELDGLVVSSPNRSVIVQRFTDQDILDLYEVRSRMESLASARAALNMTDSQRAELEHIFEAEVALTRDKPDNLSGLQDLDAAFHDQVFAGSGSKILHKILAPINIQTREARLVSLSGSGRCHGQLEEHAAIVDAIRKRDSRLAEQAMRRHIARAKDSYRTVTHLQEDNRWTKTPEQP